MPESSPDLLLQCDSCDWVTRSKGEFYQHQAEQHHISKGLDVYYARAVQQGRARGQKRKIEEITLEDSDDEFEDCDSEKTVEEKDHFRLERVNHMIDKCFSGLFQNLDIILDGILPDETDGENMNEEPIEFEKKASPFEDEVHECFDEVRTIFNEMIQIPSGLLSREESRHSKKDDKCKLPTSTERKESTGGKRIRCQYPNCNYLTTKAGLENGEAAKHILNHGLTSRDLKTRGPFFLKL